MVIVMNIAFFQPHIDLIKTFLLTTKNIEYNYVTKMLSSLVGFEPTTFGLEVRRAIHCATGTS